MTIIAWDGKTLAADRAATNCGYQRSVTKIFRVPGGIVGFAGDESRVMAFLEWFKTGMYLGMFPDFQKGDDAVGCLFIRNDGTQLAYTHTPYPAVHTDRFDAIGSGRDYALAAMYLGHDAKRAVEVACALDNGCGNGIDTLTLHEETMEMTDGQE